MKNLRLVSALLFFAHAAMAGQCTLTTSAQMVDDNGVTTSIQTTRTYSLDAQGNGSFTGSYSKEGADSVQVSGPHVDVLNSTLASEFEGLISISVNGRTLNVRNENVSASNPDLSPVTLLNNSLIFVNSESGIAIGHQVAQKLQVTCSK